MAVALAGGAGAASASAATLYVSPPPDGSDANDCMTPATACATIQHAVEEAAPGNTIEVGPGAYEEIVSVTKSLTLNGAQAGIDARDRTGAPESVLNESGGGFVVTAPDVTIDGFTVEGVSGLPFGAAIYLSHSHSGYRVANNVVRDNVLGLYANTSGATPSLVERNRFEANNRPGSASGSAIYADHGSHDLTIVANLFTGHESAAVNLAGADQSQITVSDNELVDDNSIVFFNTEDATVSGNISTDSRGSTIFLGGGNAGIAVEANRLVDSATSAVRVVDLFAGPNQDVDVIRNVISGNEFGVRVDDAASSGPLDVHGNSIAGNGVGAQTGDPDPGDAIDAAENWWGCNEGPGQPGCDTASSGVTADPWLVLTASADRASVGIGETATVTAALDRTSDGAPASLPVADTVPAFFTAARGAVAPAVATFGAGVAASTYSASGGAGDAGIAVTVDDETVPVALSVTDPAVSPPAGLTPPPPDPEPLVESAARRTIAAGAKPVIATIACPDRRCVVFDKLSLLKVDGEHRRLKVLVAQRIPGGGSAKVRVYLRRPVREALREANRGRLIVMLTVADDDGDELPVMETVELKPKT
ncbi:MAG TPA: right-handed parallel beta-helix repeat-containing protein [Solirubrobacterales bacterium]|nr:right-handed parallel beta-helix repeat-containing protein [Solirubrobacterales bacterium]